MKKLLEVPISRRSFGETFYAIGEKKLVYAIEKRKPEQKTLTANEAYCKWEHRMKNDTGFSPVANWITRNLGVQIISPQMQSPGRQGYQILISIESGISAEIIIDVLGLSGGGYGFYRKSHKPGEYLVEVVSDAWGHQNPKMIWITVQ